MSDPIIVGTLAIDPDVWQSRIDELITEYQCTPDEAEAQLRYPGEFDIADTGVTYAVPCLYLTATGRDHLEIGAYMGFGAHIVAAATSYGQLTAVLEIPAEHASWQSMRLFSGLHGGQIYATRAEAEAQLPDVA